MNENRKAHDSVARVVQEMRDQALLEYSAQTSFSPTLVRWANRLAALSAAPTPAADDAWRCFHCDETFTTRDAAAEHFGTHEHQRPACLIDVAEYRRMEAKEASYAEEDAAIHRSMYGMRSEHQMALRRAEEDGYARGLMSVKCHCAGGSQ